jgi:hypothetical protein
LLETALSTFILIFLAELGDKTQLVAFSLTTQTRKPVTVFIAASGALMMSSILAAILGGVAGSIVPAITRWAAPALFIGGGLVILLAKEPPLVKSGFLNAVALEESLLAKMRIAFRAAGIHDPELDRIIGEEQSHADVFRLLIKGKRLFKDDVNEDEDLKAAAESLSRALAVKIDPRKHPLCDTVRALDGMDAACAAFYVRLRRHLARENHEGDELAEILDRIITEEDRHRAFLSRYIRECGPGGFP